MKVKVSAIVENDAFSSAPNEVTLIKDGVKITLDKDDWKEVTETLKGKREVYYSKPKTGEFVAEYCFVHNYQKTD